MYGAELALLIGWAVLVGSLVLAAACALMWVTMTVIIRREKRDLSAQYPAHAEYHAAVRRWL